MANGEGQPAGIGCLGMVVGAVVLAAVVVLIFFIGFIVLGVVAALLVIGLLVMAIDRVLLALSPKRRERRANQQRTFVWWFGQVQSGDVIDATAIETSESSDDQRRDGPAGDELER